jgi:hypothetical protein
LGLQLKHDTISLGKQQDGGYTNRGNFKAQQITRSMAIGDGLLKRTQSAGHRALRSDSPGLVAMCFPLRQKAIGPA